MKETEHDTNKWKDIMCSYIGRTHVVKMTKLPKVKVKVNFLSLVRLFATPWTAAYQTSPSMGFSRQEYSSGVPLPSPAAVT